MPLNLEPRDNSDFTPYLKFNGKAGRWYTRNDIGEEVEVADLVAIFDLATIKTGWINFEEGMPPQQVWDTNGGIAPKPLDTPRAKRGFEVLVFSPKLGGLRAFSSTSNGAVVSMRDLYNNQFEHAPERMTMVPVVKCERVMPVKSKYGTNFEPVLKIVKWTDRPPVLQNTAAQTSKAQAIIPPPPKASDFENAVRDELDDDIPF